MEDNLLPKAHKAILERLLMKNVVRLTFAVAAAALFACSASEANAQTSIYGDGYGYGLGFSQGAQFNGGTRFNGSQFGGTRFNGGQFGGTRFNGINGNRGGFRGGNFGFGGFGGGFFGGGFDREADLPYFAKFPPVYYSGIVKRPYGISPFATPPGIIPTELQIAVPPKPVAISNPFFDAEADAIQVETESKSDSKVDDKTTQWSPNPYTEWQVSR